MAVRDLPPWVRSAPFESDVVQNLFSAIFDRQNINLQQELTSVASGDELLIFDASETGNVKTKKATVANILALISAMQYSDARFKVGSFTRDMSVATGTQAVTGVGFQPKFIIFLTGQNGALSFCFGLDNGTNSATMTNGNIIAAGAWYIGTGQSSLFLQNAAGTN